MSTTVVYKILLPEQAATYDESGTFGGAPVDHSDGFIHLSAAHQVAATLDKHFAGKGPLVLVGLDHEQMPEGSLKWEVSRGDALFPHLYANMTKSMEIVRHTLDASHQLPREFEGLAP